MPRAKKAPTTKRIPAYKAHNAAQKLIFAMAIYSGYAVKTRGPSGCILDALEVLDPKAAAKIRDGVDPSDLLDEDV